MSPRYLRYIGLAALVALVGAALPACSTPPTSAMNLMPMDALPAEVRSAPSTVRAAYQFAGSNPDVLQGVPCYCGCGDIGHTSNYSCYVSNVAADGTLTFDEHALGCSICVDITQDVMRLVRQGQLVPEIKAYVDTTYSQYGTSNMQ